MGGPSEPVAPTLFGSTANEAADPEIRAWCRATKNSYWRGRTPDGEPTVCVTLSSIAQEANAVETALMEARRLGAEVPDLQIDFSADLRTSHLGRIGTLQAPHRGYDALFRDSLLGNEFFHTTALARDLAGAKALSATALLALPHMLLLGAWHSQGGQGGGGTKFGRLYKSQIHGCGAVPADIASSRIDPAAISSSVPIYRPRENGGSSDLFANSRRPHPGWETDKDFAELDKDKSPVPYVSKKREADTKKGTAGLVNHGNIPPASRSGRATISGAVHVMDLSLTGIRTLSFPVEHGDMPDRKRDRLAWTALAAMALVAMTHRLEAGYRLRSGCDLIPVKTPRLEVVGISLEDTTPLDIDAVGARSLLNEAVAALRAVGMPWGPPKGTGLLRPGPQLIEAIHASKGLVEESGKEA
jgi:CRISPR-associated protein Csb1